VENLETYVYNLACKALPGAVAAAAVSAAMGASIIAKAMRVTLRHALPEDRNEDLQAVLDLALEQQAELLMLADADEEAYRAVLRQSARPNSTRAEREAWRRAAEVPIRVAEACRHLLEELPGVETRCWSSVKADLEIGGWLLETGLRAGLLAADENLRAWEDRTQLHPGP
jgi:formiminotetrahydrofolate cyclodeaminase